MSESPSSVRRGTKFGESQKGANTLLPSTEPGNGKNAVQNLPPLQTPSQKKVDDKIPYNLIENSKTDM